MSYEDCVRELRARMTPEEKQRIRSAVSGIGPIDESLLSKEARFGRQLVIDLLGE